MGNDQDIDHARVGEEHKQIGSGRDQGEQRGHGNARRVKGTSQSAVLSKVMERGANGDSGSIGMQEVQEEVVTGKSQSNHVHNKCMQTLMSRHYHFLVLSKCHHHVYIQQQ